jgi:hypothetical protein
MKETVGAAYPDPLTALLRDLPMNAQISKYKNLHCIIFRYRNTDFQDRPEGIATGLRNRRSGVRIPARARDFDLLQIACIASGVHQASYLKDIGVLS